jgi:hypothetical protein
VRAFVGTFVTLAGAVCGLTWLYLGMRKVMEIGGSCADGGPYVSAQPCPDGVPLMMVGGILGGLVCLGLFVFFASKLGAGYAIIAAFAWPALFLSLGWNFLEFGLDPPAPADGPEAGWLVCAVVFGLMGGLPLVFLVLPSNLRRTFWPGDPDAYTPDTTAASGIFGRRIATTIISRPSPGPPRPWRGSPTDAFGTPASEASDTAASEPSDTAASAPFAATTSEPFATTTSEPFGTTPRTNRASRPTTAAPPSDGDVVAQLERLAALRDRGALDPDEYERAKKAVLDG